MAVILLDAQGKPATPAAGTGSLYIDNTKKAPSMVDDAGRITTLQSGIVTNSNTAVVSPGAANFYITGSSLALGASVIQVNARWRWVFGITKSTAGTGIPVWTIVFGTAGTTADTARVTFTASTAQTAVADRALVTIDAVCRIASAVGVVAAIYNLTHIIVGATGFSTPASTQAEPLSTVSGTFDTTTANMIVGVCVNAGTGSAWSIETVSAQMTGI